MISASDASGSLPLWLPLSVLAWLAQMAAYHGVGLWLEWCDRTKKFRACKVRDVDRLSYGALLPRVLVNQVFVLLPAMVAAQYFGLAFVGAPHMSLWHFLAAFLLMGVGHDVVQYVAHRVILHRPSLFRTLGHSLHHSTGASKGVSACYMTSADFFLEIVLPYLIPLILVGAGADISFHMIVAALGAIGGLYEHSGYDFSLALPRKGLTGVRLRLMNALAALASSKAHGEHHCRGNVSFSDGFGSPGICDTVFSTRWDKVGAQSEPHPAEA
ncbi:sterol desaturase family protein [Methylocapsa acidiphila]|uniref:sterol desaturase family protein n=1 Tax=Methylocapsa acidiphila TaxID=133552 RepID=UPI00040A76F8|nr:sterol desaturase family protein [Methylocapsa acidiphila]